MCIKRDSLTRIFEFRIYQISFSGPFRDNFVGVILIFLNAILVKIFESVYMYPAELIVNSGDTMKTPCRVFVLPGSPNSPVTHTLRSLYKGFPVFPTFFLMVIRKSLKSFMVPFKGTKGSWVIENQLKFLETVPLNGELKIICMEHPVKNPFQFKYSPPLYIKIK